ncbi:hypothetical protein LF599_14300 [Pseudodesulfovibrio thermohalotolerans]|uniref:hypothetical protein n=1 Tax=Pseudodesulfovibrio thermohalotolerans TaxID=2880651 RepID=UPI0024422A0F|nr:hypothetical protein [Pseudodesulfovibrio thermohalotolerans]WFS61832.1 hypothetical protein LF599_14300 [Pseudodesulfovibrio thermohalotolerans]
MIKTSREFNSAHVWPKGCVLRKTVVFDQKQPFFHCPIQGSESVVSKPQTKDSKIVINCSDAPEQIGIGKTGNHWRTTRDNLSPRRKGGSQPFRPTSPFGETCQAEDTVFLVYFADRTMHSTDIRLHSTDTAVFRPFGPKNPWYALRK